MTVEYDSNFSNETGTLLGFLHLIDGAPHEVVRRTKAPQRPFDGAVGTWGGRPSTADEIVETVVLPNIDQAKSWTEALSSKSKLLGIELTRLTKLIDGRE